MVIAVRACRAWSAVLLAWAAVPAAHAAGPPDAAPPAPPQAVLAQLTESLVTPDQPGLAALLAPSRLRIHLHLPGGREIGDEQQWYGPEQVVVLLREYLDAVQMRPFDPQAGPRAEPVPDRRVWIEQPAPDPKARLRPHGILHLSVRVDGERPFEHQRVFVGLRETSWGWKVEEILHLP